MTVYLLFDNEKVNEFFLLLYLGSWIMYSNPAGIQNILTLVMASRPHDAIRYKKYDVIIQYGGSLFM